MKFYSCLRKWRKLQKITRMTITSLQTSILIQSLFRISLSGISAGFKPEQKLNLDGTKQKLNKTVAERNSAGIQPNETMERNSSWIQFNETVTERSGGEIQFNETVAEYIEFLAKLQNRNEIVNPTVLALLGDLPSISNRLQGIASNSKIHSSDVFQQATQDSAATEWLKALSQRILFSLPITYSLLNPLNATDKDPFPNVAYSMGKRPKDKELSWQSSINFYQYTLRTNDPNCYFNWACRLKRAAEILGAIPRMDPVQFHEKTYQRSSDFVVRYYECYT